MITISSWEIEGGSFILFYVLLFLIGGAIVAVAYVGLTNWTYISYHIITIILAIEDVYNNKEDDNCINYYDSYDDDDDYGDDGIYKKTNIIYDIYTILVLSIYYHFWWYQ